MVSLQLINLGPFLITTLGITELTVVYCPIRNDFQLSPLGNSREDTNTAKLIASVPFVDINVIPRQVYIHKDVVDCVGSGGSVHNHEDIPDRVYFAINYTSGRVFPVENITEASRIFIKLDGENYLVGYKYCNEEMGTNDCVLKLFKAVVPYVIANNITSLDFKNSYITTTDVQSTDEYGVVHVFGRVCCVNIECPDPDFS